MKNLNIIIFDRKLLVGLIFLFAFSIFLVTGKIDALTFNGVPSDVAHNMSVYDTVQSPPSPCYATPSLNPAIFQWVSPNFSPYTPASNVSNTTVNVSNGVTSVPFTLWHSILFCRINYSNPSIEVVALNGGNGIPSGAPPDGTLSSNIVQNVASDIKSSAVTCISGACSLFNSISVSQTPPTQTQISLRATESSRYSFRNNNFNIIFNPATPTTSTTTTTVVLRLVISAVYVEERYGIYYCTATGQKAPNQSNPPSGPLSSCQVSPLTFDITIKIPAGTTTPPPPPTPCTQPASDPHSISLPNAPLPGTSSSPPPGATTQPGAGYNYAIPGQWQITDAYDQYSNPTHITWSPTGYSNNPFTLDYINYINQYPYDDHSTTVQYSQKYNVQVYFASTSVSYYTYYCNSGDPAPSGTTCTHTTTCTSLTTSSCCPAGYTSSGGTGGKYTCTLTYPANSTAWYDYNLDYTYPTIASSSYSGAPALPEWCPRNFEVQPPPLTDVNGVSIFASGTTPDQPTQANVSTQTTVKFILKDWSQLVRNPFSVNGINYIGNYYMEHANGSGQVPIGPSPDNQTFNITGGTTPGNVTYPYQTSFAVSIPPLEVGDQICAQFNDAPQAGETDENGNITNVDSAGPVNSSQIPTNSTCSNPVANYPYSRSYGNDVISGINFSNSAVTQCDTHSSIIASITPDNGALPRGSGNQFAVLAINQIQYYASAFLRSATATANNGLSLANTTGGYGGSFDTGCQSIYNYYLNRNQGSSTSATVSNGQTYGVDDNTNSVQLTFASSGSDNYINLQSNSGNSNTNLTGEHVIYINGNVYIPNNITYNSNNVVYDSASGTVSGISNLYVIASGNIYIGPGVTQLDGVYVAQNQCDWEVVSNCSPDSGSGGIINTCADPSGVASVGTTNETDAFAPANLFSSCERQLTITGSLVGHEIKLDRTYASMRNSVGGENPIGGGQHRCQDGNGTITPATAPDCSAEIFDFNPLNYLGNPNFNTGGYKFDSIISLPPVL